MSISTSRTLSSEMPHSPETGRRIAREHGLSEFTNDVDTITPTVSAWDQHFALLSSTPDGELQLRLVQDPEGVHLFYVDRVGTRLLLKTYGENDVSSRWYKLTDTHAEWQSVATGEIERNRAAVLFPAWTDGIIGEIMWDEPAWSRKTIEADAGVDISRRLEAYEAAWRSGDPQARLLTVEDKTCSVIRVAEVDGERRSLTVAWSKEELREAWSPSSAGRVLELERLTRVTTSTYVFAAYRLALDLGDRTVDRETAVILPLGPNGRFVGELSYSMEIAV